MGIVALWLFSFGYLFKKLSRFAGSAQSKCTLQRKSRLRAIGEPTSRTASV
jgi:hypothetical protein